MARVGNKHQRFGFVGILHHQLNSNAEPCAGGFFIALSYLWGWALDGIQPDTGDWIGTGVALVGVCIAMFWRR